MPDKRRRHLEREGLQRLLDMLTEAIAAHDAGAYHDAAGTLDRCGALAASLAGRLELGPVVPVELADGRAPLPGGL